MKFSVIIPVHNEEKFILNVLKRVNHQKNILIFKLLFQMMAQPITQRKF